MNIMSQKTVDIHRYCFGKFFNIRFREDGKYWVFGTPELTKVEPGNEAPPLSLPREYAQGLLNELCRVGLRPNSEYLERNSE